MIEKILDSSGHVNSLAGILVVFIGLIAISVAIVLFNKVSHMAKRKNKENAPKPPTPEPKKTTDVKAIPEEELVAITVAVEAYRKIHFDILQNEVTFTHGNAQTAWKMLKRNRKTVTLSR